MITRTALARRSATMRILALSLLAALAPLAASASAAQVYPQSVDAATPAPPVEHARPLVPLASFASDDNYPAAAIRSNEQGRVGFALLIGPEGRVHSCTIMRSSGSAILDEWTCRLVRARARYTPARDARGNPVPDRDAGELTWTLPRP